jgi:hypothetical protein
MRYHVTDLPLNTPSLALQQLLNGLGETVVSIVADTANNRLIIVTRV